MLAGVGAGTAEADSSGVPECSFCPVNWDQFTIGDSADDVEWWREREGYDEEDALKDPRNPWGGEHGNKRGRLLAYKTCTLANKIACHRNVDGDAEPCWATTPVLKTRTLLEWVASTLPAWIMCGKKSCTGAGLGALMVPIVLIWAVVLAVMAGRVFLDHNRIGDLMFYIAAVVMMYTLAQGAARGGETIWNLIGHTANAGGAFGLTMIGGAATTGGLSGLDLYCHERAGTMSVTTAWDKAGRSIDQYIRHAVDIGAISGGVARSMMPAGIADAMQGMFDSVQKTSMKLASGDHSAIIDPLLEITRFIFGMAIAMAALTAIVNTIVLIMESLITAVITTALLPLTLCLGVFKGTRSALKNTMSAVLSLVVTLAILGVTTAMAIGVMGVTTDYFIKEMTADEGMFAKIREAEGKEAGTGVREKMIGEGCGRIRGELGDLEHRGMRTSFHLYVQALGCEGQYVSEKGHSKDYDGKSLFASYARETPRHWLWPIVLFTIAVLAATAIIKSSAAISSELTSFQGGGQLASKVASRVEQMGQAASGKMGQTMGRLGRG